ncbi:MAG: ATP-binding cassette domain-containing protein [Saprospiraceae bacterium]|nr:ATP-binding cassette domain-containing protein [Saprospiraceae bacterium]
MENIAQLSPLQRFFRLLALDKKDIYYIYIYAIFGGLINLALPLGIQAIIGLIAGGAISASLILLVTIVTAATALSGILVVMQLTVTETIQRRIFVRSAFEFAFRIPRLKLDAMTKYYPPELVNRFFDTLTVQKGLPKLLMDFSSAVLNIFFGLILISFYHPFFVFFGMALLIILFIIFRFTSPNGLKTSLKESKYKYEVAHWLEELARAMNTFKLAGNTPLSLNNTDDLVCNYLDNRKKHFRILLTQYGSIVGFKTIVTASLLFLGSFLVIDNQINIGQFVAAEIVVILVMNSVEKLILSMDNVYDVLTALEKLGSVTDLPVEEEGGLPFEEIDTKKGIQLNINDLYFKYDDAERPTLDHLSLQVEAGEKLCIAGYNGSGKSTLIQIIAGLFSNFEGNVNYNGFPMKNLDLSSLRHHIGDTSSQESIFKGTIIQNISLGHPDVKLEDIIRATEQVGLSDYIQRLPNGYNTMLQPEGKNIPQNIRAKIILARSVVSKPQLLAMESFLNNLEQIDRSAITEFLTAADKPWTLIAVTDDPMFASKCQRILIMEEGKIIESGTFDQIQKSAHFKKVFKVTDTENRFISSKIEKR